MISFFILVIIYFGFSWILPWNKIPSNISFSYVFDLLFALGVSFFFRLPWKFKWKINMQTLKAFGEVVALAVLQERVHGCKPGRVLQQAASGFVSDVFEERPMTIELLPARSSLPVVRLQTHTRGEELGGILEACSCDMFAEDGLCV